MNNTVDDKPIAYGPCRKPWRESLSAVAVSTTDGCLLVSPPSSDPLDLTSYNEIPGILFRTHEGGAGCSHGRNTKSLKKCKYE